MLVPRAAALLRRCLSRRGLRAMRLIATYLYYPFALVLSVLVIINAADADRLMQLAAEMQSLSGSTRMAWVSLLERLSFSWYSGATELADGYAQIAAEAARAEKYWMLAGVAFSAATLGQILFIYLSRPHDHAVFAWHLNLIALAAFVVGVWTPMLTVIAHAEVPVLGDVVLRYDSKSIFSTVAGLLASANWLLAVLIGLFSIALPVTKMILIAVILVPRGEALRTRGLALLHAVGKWSMADVFVVAVLVAFLALNKDAFSSAQTGPGLYFFSAYCVLSMWAAQRASKTITEPP
jgi:paraquat-inducible protein A